MAIGRKIFSATQERTALSFFRYCQRELRAAVRYQKFAFAHDATVDPLFAKKDNESKHEIVPAYRFEFFFSVCFSSFHFYPRNCFENSAMPRAAGGICARKSRSGLLRAFNYIFGENAFQYCYDTFLRFLPQKECRIESKTVGFVIRQNSHF